jgi:hypothetical protein
VTGEIEVALTEDFDTAAADQAEDLEVGDADGQAAVMEFDEGDAEDIEGTVDIEGVVEGDSAVDVDVALGAARIQHAARERGRARELFEQLAALPAGDKERHQVHRPVRPQPRRRVLHLRDADHRRGDQAALPG